MVSPNSILQVVGGVIKVITGLYSLWPRSDGPKTTVRIAVGLDGHSLTGAGGSDPKIILFNANYDRFGDNIDVSYYTVPSGQPPPCEPAWGSIESGNVKDYANNQADTKQAQYIKLSMPDDEGICIAYVSVTWADGNDAFAWLGDWGLACGAASW